jgi:hypothetical protein
MPSQNIPLSTFLGGVTASGPGWGITPVVGILLGRMEMAMLGMLDLLLPLCPAFSSSEDKVKLEEGQVHWLSSLVEERRWKGLRDGVGTISGHTGGLMQALNLILWHTCSLKRR